MNVRLRQLQRLDWLCWSSLLRGNRANPDLHSLKPQSPRQSSINQDPLRDCVAQSLHRWHQAHLKRICVDSLLGQ
ncbi:hypothetical protein D3C86_958550 [compost metagenome]